jgi:hypothetical protein
VRIKLDDKTCTNLCIDPNNPTAYQIDRWNRGGQNGNRHGNAGTTPRGRPNDINTNRGEGGGGPRSAFPEALTRGGEVPPLTKTALKEHTKRDEADRADRRRRGIQPGETEDTETEETDDSRSRRDPDGNRRHRSGSRSRRDPDGNGGHRSGSRSRRNSEGNERHGSRRIGRSESRTENRRRRPPNVGTGNVSII